MVLHGRNGKAAKPSPKSINDRIADEAIDDRTPREKEDLARQVRKCADYVVPSLVYPAISSTNPAAIVVRHNAGQKRAGHAINDRTCAHHIFVHSSGCIHLFPSRTRHKPSEAYCSHNKPGKAYLTSFQNTTTLDSRSRQRSRSWTHNRVRRCYGRLLMCKLTMYKRARNDAHAPTVV